MKNGEDSFIKILNNQVQFRIKKREKLSIIIDIVISHALRECGNTTTLALAFVIAAILGSGIITNR